LIILFATEVSQAFTDPHFSSWFARIAVPLFSVPYNAFFEFDVQDFPSVHHVWLCFAYSFWGYSHEFSHRAFELR
jgi:hypothetical protein